VTVPNDSDPRDGGPLRLFRDVLDSQMVDRAGRHAGKVDGTVAELRDDGPPVLTVLENGVPELVRRVSPRVGDWIAALGELLHPQITQIEQR
jgi:hypothetical protein